MKTMTWMLLTAAAVTAVSFLGAPPALAQAGDEVVAAETEYCGICEAKKSVAGMLPDWFTFGLDQRNRVTYKTNNTTLGLNGTEESLFGRFRTRLWGRATPIEDVEIGARLVWEWFVICKPEAADNTPSSDVTFDELYVKLTDVLGLPMQLTIGRQNMRLGDGWLVFEGTPLDGSRTIFFDAVRATYAMADQNMTLDAIFVANRADADTYIKPFNDNAVERNLIEADETGGILWLTNTANPDLTWNGYLIYVHRDDPDSSDEGEVLKQWLAFKKDESTLKSKLKLTEEDLDDRACAQYPKLSQTEIKTLVVGAKWMAALESALQGELDRVSQRLTQRVRELAERYAAPLPQMAGQVDDLEAKVNAHLEKMGFSW